MLRAQHAVLLLGLLGSVAGLEPAVRRGRREPVAPAAAPVPPVLRRDEATQYTVEAAGGGRSAPASALEAGADAGPPGVRVDLPQEASTLPKRRNADTIVLHDRYGAALVLGNQPVVRVRDARGRWFVGVVRPRDVRNAARAVATHPGLGGLVLGIRGVELNAYGRREPTTKYVLWDERARGGKAKSYAHLRAGVARPELAEVAVEVLQRWPGEGPGFVWARGDDEREAVAELRSGEELVAQLAVAKAGVRPEFALDGFRIDDTHVQVAKAELSESWLMASEEHRALRRRLEKPQGLVLSLRQPVQPEGEGDGTGVAPHGLGIALPDLSSVLMPVQAPTDLAACGVDSLDCGCGEVDEGALEVIACVLCCPCYVYAKLS